MESDSDKYALFCHFIREHLPNWKHLADAEIQFEPLRGLTNEVFKVTPRKPDVTPNPIIFRKFSENLNIVDRPRERRLFKELAEGGHGPKCFGDSEKYRIEEYIHSQTLIGPDYNKTNIRREIARALAKFHKIEIPWLEKSRFLPNDLENAALCKAFEDKCDADIYDESEKEIVKKMRQVTSQEEKEFLEKIIPSDDIVLSHNDLSNGNQLLGNDNGEVMLIDFEYCGKNFRGFDMGYIYQQSIFAPNSQPPYFKVEEGNFPTDEEFRDFLHYYIVFTDISEEEEKKIGGKLMKNEQEFSDYIKQKYNEEELKKRTEKLLREAKIGALVCCHYITTWATKMYKTVTNDFGYFKFAKEGYAKYQKYKEELSKTS